MSLVICYTYSVVTISASVFQAKISVNIRDHMRLTKIIMGVMNQLDECFN